MPMMRTLRAQAAETLRERIVTQHQPGDRLPPESELARDMGLSRNTVREAVAQLVNEGLLDRRWGVGTTVLAPRPAATFSLTDAQPIWRIIELGGHVPSIARFSADVVPGRGPAADALHLAGGSEMWRIERLFAIDGAPAILLRDWCPRVVDGRELVVESLRETTGELPALIQAQTGAVPERMEGRLDAVVAEGDLAAPTGVPTSVIQVTQTLRGRDDAALAYSILQFDTRVVDLTLRRFFTAP